MQRIFRSGFRTCIGIVDLWRTAGRQVLHTLPAKPGVRVEEIPKRILRILLQGACSVGENRDRGRVKKCQIQRLERLPANRDLRFS